MRPEGDSFNDKSTDHQITQNNREICTQKDDDASIYVGLHIHFTFSEASEKEVLLKQCNELTTAK
jgi:hypothetical protein